MVAASKLRRAQERVIAARPFAQRMLRVLNEPRGARRSRRRTRCCASASGAGRPAAADRRSPADRGLCGSFNTNIIKARRAVHRRRDAGPRRRARPGRPQGPRLLRPPRLRRALRGGRHLPEADVRRRRRRSPTPAIEEFIVGRGRQRVSRLQRVQVGDAQRIVVERLLPIPRARSATRPQPAAAQVDYLYEPAPQEIFDELLPRYVEVQVYRALLESNAAFFAAQMTAMDAATRNSAEMIESLTLYMNKVRQAAITREIIEVVSGAAAT